HEIQVRDDRLSERLPCFGGLPADGGIRGEEHGHGEGGAGCPGDHPRQRDAEQRAPAPEHDRAGRRQQDHQALLDKVVVGRLTEQREVCAWCPCADQGAGELSDEVAAPVPFRFRTAPAGSEPFHRRRERWWGGEQRGERQGGAKSDQRARRQDEPDHDGSPDGLRNRCPFGGLAKRCSHTKAPAYRKMTMARTACPLKVPNGATYDWLSRAKAV